MRIVLFTCFFPALALCYLTLPLVSLKISGISKIEPLGRLLFSRGQNNKLFSSYTVSRCDAYSEIVKKPKWGGPILGVFLRWLNVLFVGTICSIILRVFNNLKTFGMEKIYNNIWNRGRGKGFVTVCNHLSVMDDPGLMSALLPFWKIHPDLMRWSICTEDVFFANKWLSKIIAAGNVLPLDRSGSLEQPMFERFWEKLNSGSWCHIFAEGRVWQRWRFDGDEVRLGKFKFGVGKLIAHCDQCPIVIPFYHKGMDTIIPEKVLKDRKSKKPSFPITVIPKIGKSIETYVGDPIDFTEKIRCFREKHPGMLDKWQSTAETIDLYVEITNDIYKEMIKLENKAWPKSAEYYAQIQPSSV